MRWQITDAETLCERLRRMGATEIVDPGDGQFAHLFAWRGVERPWMLAWTPLSPILANRISGEQELDDHPFARWLGVRPTLGLWGIATAWTLYWQSLHVESSGTTAFQVLDCPATDPLLDDLLRVSRGWLLWDFQLSLLKNMAVRYSEANRWNLGDLALGGLDPSPTSPHEAVLPNARSIPEVLTERQPLGKPPVPLPAQISWRILALRRS